MIFWRRNRNWRIEVQKHLGSLRAKLILRINSITNKHETASVADDRQPWHRWKQGRKSAVVGEFGSCAVDGCRLVRSVRTDDGPNYKGRCPAHEKSGSTLVHTGLREPGETFGRQLDRNAQNDSTISLGAGLPGDCKLIGTGIKCASRGPLRH